MWSFYRKYYKTVFDIALIVVTVYLFMWLFSYLYRLATPIFLAFVIFAVIEPPARLLARRMPKSVATAISMLVFILVILGALTALGIVFTGQILNLIDKMPVYQRILQEQIAANADYLREKISALPPDVTEKAKTFAANITVYGAQLAQVFLKWLFASLTSVSSFVVNFVAGIILAYFLSIEIESWKRLAHDKTPRTFKTAYFFLKENVLLGIGHYLKAQLKLVSITFIIVFAALLALRVNNSFSVALLSAVFDILPLLGVSTLFIPWILYLFITGSTTLAIWLCIVLAVVLGVRQILEPKITGESLGVSAFTMLSFMIISLSLFGVAGLILSPVLIILLKALRDQGYLKRWIRLPEGEYDQSQGR